MTRILLAAMLWLGCSFPRPGDAPKVKFGRQECARCRMIVSDARFAAGYVDDTGETVAYDDLGEMLGEITRKPELRARSWVSDYHGAGWLKLGDAYTVRIPGFATPMGTGWLAFVSQAEAEKLRKIGPER